MIGTEKRTDYEKYRGKCKEFSEAYCKEHPEYHLVRGYYHDDVWGKQQHWWCEDDVGNVYDPTRKQFPSGKSGVLHVPYDSIQKSIFYEEFDGRYQCEYCGKMVAEDSAYMHFQHVYCSYECYGKDVMG